MDLIRAGIEFTKTVRNVNRLREIVSVFAKNGFQEFISRGVTSRIPDFVLPDSKIKLKEELRDKDNNDISAIIGKRLRFCFEELGPAFIKIGQLLSSREDIFPAPFIEEMKLLRDQVKGIPFAQAKEVIELALKRPVSEVFSHVDEEPVGKASIGIVYRAQLKTGESVVIKVKRPNIYKTIQVDMGLFLFIVQQAEKMSEDLKFLGLSKVIYDFSVAINNELNFQYEALNCKRLKKNLERHDHEKIIYIPKIYDEWTSENVLVMEFLDGIPFSNPRVMDSKETLYPQLEKGIHLFLKSFLEDGFFHADLHGGNFFLMKDGAIGLVDFGLMGNLSKKGRMNFLAIIYSLVNFNFDNLVYEFLDVAEYESIPNVEQLVRDVRDGLMPFVGLTVQQMNMAKSLKIITGTLAKHQVYIPRDWFIVFRALITLDGVGRSVGMDFDIFGALEKTVPELLKGSMKKEDLLEEGLWFAKDLAVNLRLIPRHIRWFTKEFSKNGYAIEVRHKELDKHAQLLSRSVAFLGLSIVSSVMLISGVILLGGVRPSSFQDVPTLSWAFWGIGVGVLFFSSALLKKEK